VTARATIPLRFRPRSTPGTYLVSNTIDWVGCCVTIHGTGAGQTIIKLRDNAPGFGDPAAPKPVIKTQDGNMAFRNNIYHLTIDTGRGNAGAIGADYIASNHGIMRHVTIRSGDRGGAVGLAMTRKWPGPLMIKDVQIDGFGIGIDIAHGEYGVTLENIRLTNQTSAGLRCETNTVAIRKLTSINSVPAIRTIPYLNNPTGPGICTLVLLDSALTGGAASVSAIENTGLLYARNVQTSGYQSAIRDDGRIVAGANVSEYSSKTERLFADTPLRSLNLPIEETPTFDDPNLANWAAITCTGYAPSCAVGSQLQAALNSGKSTVYFPFVTRQVYDQLVVTVPPGVRRIVGFSSVINGGSPTNGGGIRFVVSGDAPHPIIFDQLGYGVTVEHSGTRTVVLRDGKYRYRSTPGAGDLFMENVEVHGFEMHASQRVWARQFNNERRDGTKIVNNGGQLWVLGIKTEGIHTVLLNQPRSRSELLGVHVYPAQEFKTDADKQAPIFVSRDASFAAIYAAISFSEAETYGVQIEETRGSVTKRMTTKDAPLYYSRMGLYVGYPPGPLRSNAAFLPLARRN
jgi:hypothetical protein